MQAISGMRAVGFPTRPLVCSRALAPCVRAFVDDVAKAPKAAKAPAKKAKKAVEGAIKRAPSAFNLYFKATIGDLKAKAAPGTKVTELTPQLAKLWKELSEEEKKPYVEEANVRKAEVATLRGDAKAEAKKNAKPVIPYAKYVGAHFAECKASNPSLTTAEVVKQLAYNWKEVSPEAKEQMKKEYSAELEAWKAKQVQQ